MFTMYQYWFKNLFDPGKGCFIYVYSMKDQGWTTKFPWVSSNKIQFICKQTMQTKSYKIKPAQRNLVVHSPS